MAALKPFLDELEEDLTCSICHDIFTEPKCLPCFHSFCKKCIVEWYETSGNPATEKFDCPICRTRTDLPGGDASKLTPSFYLGSLPRLLRAMRNKPDQGQTVAESKCEGCDKFCRLVAFCPQCNCLICGECVNAHKNLKHLREEHHLTLFSDFDQENVNSFIRNQMVCKEKYHEKNKLEYYCKEETCKRCVCQKCAILYHQNHQMQSIEEAAEQVKTQLQGEVDRVDKLMEKYEEELGESSGNMERIQSEVNSAKKKVQDTVNLVYKIVSEHARAMLNDLHKILQDEKEAYGEEQKDINSGIKHLSDFKNYTQALLKRSVAYELLESNGAILDKSERLCSTTSMLSTKPIDRNVTVDYVTGQVMQSLNNIGKIVKNVVDPSLSTIEPLKDARCGFLNAFQVVTRNTKGEICHTTEPIEVQITDFEGNEVDKTVCENQDGKLLVKYMAELPLPYDVTVKLGDESIGNSPKSLDTLPIEADFLLTTLLEEDDEDLLNGPQSIAVSSQGEVAIADTGNDRIHIFSSQGNYLRMFGSKGTEEGKFIYPFTVAFIEDSILVCDIPDPALGRRVQEFSLTGNYVQTLVWPEQMMILNDLCNVDGTFIAICCIGDMRGPIPSIKVFNRRGDWFQEFDIERNECPIGIEYCNGKYFVSYGEKNFIRVYDEHGVCLRKFGKEGGKDGQFNTIYGVAAYGPDMILVCDIRNYRVQLLTQEGEFVRSFGGTDVQVWGISPIDVAVTSDGQVLVLDYAYGEVHVWC